MFITKKFLDTAGRHSPEVRSAMVQAGDKNRIKALKSFLISIGVCEITFEDVKNFNLTVQERKYSFSTVVLTYAFLENEYFNRFKRLENPVLLEIAHIRNGLIGIRKREDHA